MKCAACTKHVRKLQRAWVVTGPGKLRAGRVCSPCAVTGILIVFGGEDRPTRRRRERETLQADRVLTVAAYELGRRDASDALPPKGKRCDAHTERTRRRCMLPNGHEGSHRSMMGGAWSETAQEDRDA